MYAVGFVTGIAMITGRAAAESDGDPQAGFGVLIAMVAILVALVLARRKRQHYQQQSG